MPENKTQKTAASVDAFIATVPDEQKQADARQLVEIFSDITKQPPKMWGSAIIGFGDVHYKYDSGREGDWFLAGFSPRKANLTLYLAGGLNQDPELLKALGKYKTGKGCLYINRLSDVHLPTLKKLIRTSVKNHKAQAK